MKQPISIRAAFRESYQIIKPRFWTVIGQYALLSIVFFAFSILGGSNVLVAILISLLSTFCIVSFSLAYATKGSFVLEDLFAELTFRRFVYYFLAFLLVGIAIFGGLILIIIPGIILAVRLSLVRYIAVEKEIKPVDAFKESIELTRGHGWTIVGFGLLSVLVNILGAICLIVGLLFTIPLTTIAFAVLYRQLSGRGNEDEIEIVETVIVEEVVA